MLTALLGQVYANLSEVSVPKLLTTLIDLLIDLESKSTYDCTSLSQPGILL